MPWKFCPECGSKFEAAHKFCAECGQKRDGSAVPPSRDGALAEFARRYAEQAGKLPAPKSPWVHPLDRPQVVPLMPKRCAYDGLPPGAYHLYCDCPKCSPQMGTATTVRH